ncbi:MAG: CRISPR-associated endoribonuclease Cas6 [Oscillospiraceae bacterium]|nr:CRISPR-associated endoribonuclease Cas6 [Oscillospiraceae bacterium]
MKIHELILKVYLLNDIRLENVQREICKIIDNCFFVIGDFPSIHIENRFKYYVFSGFYPLEMDKIYKKDTTYTVTIRTIDDYLSDHFIKYLSDEKTSSIKALTIEHRILPQYKIERLFSLTPCILKFEEGYWRNHFPIDEFERRLKENLIKKYNSFFDKKVDEDFKVYDILEFTNKKPVSTNYKNIKLLGDKITLYISSDEQAQEFAYFLLGTGILEMNSRGYGFMNGVWKR